jgi:hypothetical protein
VVILISSILRPDPLESIFSSSSSLLSSASATSAEAAAAVFLSFGAFLTCCLLPLKNEDDLL